MPITALTDIAGASVALDRAAGLIVSANRVTAWLDQSGNGNHPTFDAGREPFAVAGSRVAFGHNIGGAEPRMDLPASLVVDKQSMTLVLIGRLNNVSHNTGGILVAFNNPTIYVQVGDNGLVFPGLPLPEATGLPSSPSVFILRLSTTFSKLRINGHTWVAAAPGDGIVSGSMTIGNSIPFNTLVAPFELDELAVYNRAISDGEVDDVVAYAVANYPGVTGSLPTSRVVVDGDSIGFGKFGVGAGTGYATINAGWNALLSLPAGCELENFAKTGFAYADLLADVATQIVPRASADGVATATLIDACGFNDINSGRTGAQVYADKVAYCQAAVDGGYDKVITCTVTPGAGTEVRKEALRALLLADFSVATSHPRVWLPGAGVTYAHALVDISGNPTIGLLNANDNTTYYRDGIHPSGQGHAVYAEDVQAALDIVLGTPVGTAQRNTRISLGLPRLGL